MNIPEHVWDKDGFKSSYSDKGGDCVEVVGFAGVVGVRDSKDRQGRQIVVPAQGWRGFLATLRTEK